MVGHFLFIGTTELLLIGGMALLLFGGKKLPEMMHGLGQGVREFKKGVKDIKEDVESEVADDVPENDMSSSSQTEASSENEKQKNTDGE